MISMRWTALTLCLLCIRSLPAGAAASAAVDLRPVPEGARLAFTEDWAGGKIDPAKWYLLRKRWGDGNRGVVPENVSIGRDTVAGQECNVLVCEAHGDAYDGPVIGERGGKT